MPLSEQQLRTLSAAVDRIVPGDDFPSGVEAGCIDFLIRLIGLESLETIYSDGLDHLNSASLAKGKPFADMHPAQQDEILYELRHGADSDNRHFIATLAQQTIEGYYSDPGNGGNKDQAGWKAIGFEVRG